MNRSKLSAGLFGVFGLALAAPVLGGQPLPVAPPPREVKPANPGDAAKANAAAYKALSDSIRDKLLKAGGKPPEKKPDDTPTRNMRWTLRFKVASGKDYVQQLDALGAALVVPVPGEKEKVVYVPDLKKPADRREPAEADWKPLAEKIKFADQRKQVAEAVGKELGLDFTPKEFWAFFPKDLETELARKETAYKNAHAEDIEETVFAVTIKDGKPEITVTEQRLQKK